MEKKSSQMKRAEKALKAMTKEETLKLLESIKKFSLKK